MPYWIQTLPSLGASWWALNLCDLFLTNKKQNKSFFFIRANSRNTHTQKSWQTSKKPHAKCSSGTDTGGFSTVCVGARGRKGACKGTVSLWKTSMKQHCVWFTVRIRLCICMGLILWEVACKQRRNVVPLSTLWCRILIHQKETLTETLFRTISLALFPPSRQESVPITRARTHLHTHTQGLHFAAQHCHQVAGNGHGPCTGPRRAAPHAGSRCST